MLTVNVRKNGQVFIGQNLLGTILPNVSGFTAFRIGVKNQSFMFSEKSQAIGWLATTVSRPFVISYE